MLTALMVLLRSIGLICCGHRAIALENLALRQQLAVFKRTVQGPRLRPRRSTVLGSARSRLAELAFGLDRRAARDGGRLASALAPMPMDAPLEARSSWPAQQHHDHSDAGPPDERGQPAVGRASDPWRIM